LSFLLPPRRRGGGDRGVRAVRVDVSALDLSTPAGMKALEGRIARTVNRICDDDPGCRDEASNSIPTRAAPPASPGPE